MDPHHTGQYGSLDEIRIQEGLEACRSAFEEAYTADVQSAIDLLNDPLITFPTLFLLLPSIQALGIASELNERNAMAVRIVRQILGAGGANRSENDLSRVKEPVRPVLLWMVQSGVEEHRLGSAYQKTLDIAVSVLLVTYGEISILAMVDNLIFERHRRGQHVHDLVWAFFRAHDPVALKLMAEHVQSAESEEAELACRLLHVDPAQAGDAGQRQRAYAAYVQWLEENDPYVYFTGESLQYASRPAVCKVDLASKYVQKARATRSVGAVLPADAKEREYLDKFALLGVEEQHVLSAFSQAMHEQDVAAWSTWIDIPVDAQIEAAKAGLGGSR